jgi:hypothetical protein
MAIVTLECARLHEPTFLVWLHEHRVSYEFSLNTSDPGSIFPVATFHGEVSDLRAMIGAFWLNEELKKSIEY